MKIFDLDDNSIKPGFDDLPKNHHSFIACTPQELIELSVLPPTFSSILYHKLQPGKLQEDIRFESHPGMDFLSFIYYELHGKNFVFENFALLSIENMLFFLSSGDGVLHTSFIDKFYSSFLSEYEGRIPLPFVYYQLLNRAFSNMFESLSTYESQLFDMEDQIVDNSEQFELAQIVEIRNTCFHINKRNRQLLYVGDQLLLNDNGLVPPLYVRYLHNLDSRINKLYEYSVDIYRACEHLMDLYDSNMSARTNDIIGKLTIFTAFATPITVITGLYGMNFSNMPELQNPHGYFIVLGIIALIIVITFILLKRAKLL